MKSATTLIAILLTLLTPTISNTAAYLFGEEDQVSKSFNGIGRPELTEETLLYYMGELSDRNQSDEADVEYLLGSLVRFGELAAQFKSEALKDALLRFRAESNVVETAKLVGLRNVYQMRGVRDYHFSLLNSNDDSMVQKTIAHTFIEFGESWKVTEPIVRKHELFAFMGIYEVKESIPMLLEAIKSASFNGQINAAHSLEKLGRKDMSVKAAENILKNAPVSDEQKILRPVHMAIKIAKEHSMTYLAKDIARFAYVENSILVGDAVSTLITFSVTDHSPTAKSLLKDIQSRTRDEYLARRIETFFQEKH